jgi:hypothetical protein
VPLWSNRVGSKLEDRAHILCHCDTWKIPFSRTYTLTRIVPLVLWLGSTGRFIKKLSESRMFSSRRRNSTLMPIMVIRDFDFILLLLTEYNSEARLSTTTIVPTAWRTFTTIKLWWVIRLLSGPFFSTKESQSNLEQKSTERLAFLGNQSSFFSYPWNADSGSMPHDSHCQRGVKVYC